MLLNAYSIFDTKALIFHAPFFFAQDGQAVRALSDLVADTNTQIGRHPADFVLYRVGDWDDQSGQLGGDRTRVHVVDAISLVPRNLAEQPLFNQLTTASKE